MNAPRFGLALLSVLALGGCLQFPAGGPAPDRYDFAPIRDVSGPAMPDGWSLLIETPSSRGILGTDHMAWRTRDGRIEYYAKARWADRLPRLVSEHLTDILSQAGGTVSGPQNFDVPSRYRLRTSIRAFEAVETGEGAHAHIRLDLDLIRSVPFSIASQQVIDVTAPAASDRPRDVRRAFDAALKEADGRILAWLRETAEKSGL